MKRFLVVFLALGLVVGSVATADAKKKKAKPVQTTLFLHGVTPIGENDSMAVVNEAYMPMDPQKPSAAQPASRFITNAFVTPNTKCAGNTLFPIWTGKLAGRVTGDVKVTFHHVGTPGSVVVRIWPDVNGQMCDSEASGTKSYIEPAGEVTVELPPGTGVVEAVLEDVDFTSLGSLMLQLSPAVQVPLPSPANPVLSPFVSRVLYDTPDYASSIEFMCTPTSGSSCV